MKALALVSLACLLASCAGSRQADACRYRERDLTVDFAQRTYWCIPGDRK
jgi:lipoprotein